MSKNRNNLGFWVKPSGSIMTSSKGLTKEDITFLQSLKEGDRLIMWDNSSKAEGTNNPTHNLTKYQKLEAKESVGTSHEKTKRSNSKSILA